MTKPLLIKNINETKIHKERIQEHLRRNTQAISELIQQNEPLTVFERFKFDKIGCEPLTGEPENLIEVINQCHTYLVSLIAVEQLLIRHPEKDFIVNWGNIPGYDIESSDGTVIAECFAATSYKSNGKLTADLKRLAANTTAAYKYEFFYDREFTDNHKAYYKEKYSDIEIVKFKTIQ